DLFFSGNEAPNRLYLNKGNLQFEDISEKAGINQNKKWAMGATMADVNGDGWLDIYVGQAGPYTDANDRKNLLFINNGDLTFSEQAEAYGLADGNYTTQAAFFDYDNDGDLDCYVLNESKYAGVVYQRVFEDLKQK
ncbi:VCBS repeat-containing protein, partial [Arthrospira platensis SPKY1]|nr:VCBS repeat-containing protein [Arthrospira platensis SPKY1]